MNSACVLCLALALDAILGEPEWLWSKAPHPAVLMGRLIGWGDRQFNKGSLKKAKGIGLVCALVLLGAVIGMLLGLLGPIVEAIVAAALLAQRSLVQHVQAVADGLRLSLLQGRRAVSMIVSRDTSDMQPDAVARSAIESASENLSDGVIAPAFWFLIGGLPGILIYKFINTADSMIGYRTPRHADFGWAAARLDDLLNWVPARLTAFFIALPAGVLQHWSKIRSDAAQHRSPNAGWPEAAMAQANAIALAGPRAYDGKMQEFAWVNGTGNRTIGPSDIDACVTRLWQAWGVAFITTLTFGILLS